MKSKISFFNKTIFKKNVTLYWPIWVLYTVLLVFAQPVMFWSSCYYSKFYDEYTYQDKLEDLIEVIYLDMHVYLIALVALVCGMALFHYLYNHKSANMIHAFPVDRTQLFGTNVISGFSFLAVPQTISSVLLVIVAMCNGVSEVYYVAYWWLLALGTDIVAIAVVTFCAMFTGHLVALPVYALIVNYFSYLIYYLVYVTVSLFGFGISDLGRETERIVALFSPTECFVYNVGLCENFDPVTQECTGVLVYGVEVLAVYLVVAVMLYIAAFITYKKRHIEQAGEFITVGWVKPIFRFGIAVAGGFFGGILMREFLRGIGIGCNMIMFVMLLLIIGGICFFIADMLIHKSFHVFKKKNWMHCAICMVAIVVTFFGILAIGKQYENYQPELAEVATAYVDWGYEIQFEGEEVATVFAIHDEILKNREVFVDAQERGRGSYEYVRIGYLLKDGETIRRAYQLPSEYVETYGILTQIAELELDAERYLDYVFVENYEKIEVFDDGWFEGRFADDSFVDSEGNTIYNFDTINFSPEQTKEMYDAVVADAKAGTLMKYNIHRQWIAEEMKNSSAYKSTEAYIYIKFQNPNEENDTKLLLEEYSYTYPGGASVEQYVDAETWYSANLTFGPDCEHIVSKLIEFGFIESVDDVFWGELVEETQNTQ
ncbi:MAG: hypothetical protein IJO60_08400 [Agathobacter sp.]|nr:hypothetical protein [Agathobacter sp.]